MSSVPEQRLRREIRTPGAILMGLGSIIGTGIFVSVAIATRAAGNGVILAILLSSILAILNGLSSAQLAAAHPMSGGTYEYANRFLGPWSGFTAGWMFLAAKSASAATAVLGAVGYIFYAADLDASRLEITGAGLLILLLMTWLVSRGIRRSNRANGTIVLFTFLGLTVFVAAGFYYFGTPEQLLADVFAGPFTSDSFSFSSVLHGTALMFVAFTGYGRIATLGEEVLDPRRTIPRAIIQTMILIVILYLAVTLTALQIMGADAFARTVEGETAPLMAVAELIPLPAVGVIVTVAAITAMLGVLLNLILGLSRVMLAMARRKDLPQRLARIDAETQSPGPAVWTTGALIGLLVLSGSVVFTWSFSAFAVLVYYSLNNLSALALPEELRFYPNMVPFAGLLGSLLLVFWIEPRIWISGLALIVAGLIWHAVSIRNRVRAV